MKLPILLLLGSYSLSGMAYDVQAISDAVADANNLTRITTYVANNTFAECGENFTACSNGKVIVLSELLLSRVQNEDELAGVIGHEMAHKVYRDEMKADVLGLEYAEHAGYNYCRAAQMLLKTGAGGKGHPSGQTRYENTGCSK